MLNVKRITIQHQLAMYNCHIWQIIKSLHVGGSRANSAYAVNLNRQSHKYTVV